MTLRGAQKDENRTGEEWSAEGRCIVEILKGERARKPESKECGDNEGADAQGDCKESCESAHPFLVLELGNLIRTGLCIGREGGGEEGGKGRGLMTGLKLHFALITQFSDNAANNSPRSFKDGGINGTPFI